MAVEPKYQFRDLPTFSGDINKDPQYFIHKFETFLRYINLTVADGQAVENALTHLGTCLYKDAQRMVQNTCWSSKITCRKKDKGPNMIN